jgi:phage terminase large subunit-like protein
MEPQDQYFAGIITALTDANVTVTRTVLGKESTVRTFTITPETHIEGKPKLKSRVTVRFLADERGDRAVRIIVRGAPQQKKQ